MSSGALKYQPKQKRGTARALPAPPPPRTLFPEYMTGVRQAFRYTLVRFLI